ncbi:MAG: DUF928 domain-containing protein [Scytonema sp. PMC 1069.18]|nr:DUF928 domain-containing protein [Scytonema sp. PMC 1069.18]MEC4880563.1 DUF928 domain-containing protein [Scytonema sp. PMC 1070.18]
MKTFLQHKLITASLATVTTLSFLLPLTSAEARITFKAPENLGDAPGRRVAGAARDRKYCILDNDNERLTAIVPRSNIGLTTEDKPVLYFYVPQTSKQAKYELVVQDKSGEFVKQTYKPSGKSGIVAIPLTKSSLKVGEEYRWYFAVVCNSDARSTDEVVRGSIKRVQPQDQLLTKLKSATPQERVTLYAQAGIWQDSLNALAQLRSSRPTDAELKADWEALLTGEGVGLDKEEKSPGKLVHAPLLLGQEAPQPL